MKTPRWLFPFTFGVDMAAIDSVVRLAQSAEAMLLPVSLISSLPGGARLEYIQQSKDFLEAVHYKAVRYQVTVERYEVFTANVLESLTTLVHDIRCEGIVLVTRGEQARLMQNEEMKPLLRQPPAALVLIRLPVRSGWVRAPRPGARLLSWLRSRWEPQNGASHARTQDAPRAEEPVWIRTEQHRLG